MNGPGSINSLPVPHFTKQSNIMKKLLIVTAAALAFGAQAQTVDNWVTSAGPVKNSTGLCWRNASWTPATAHPDCDGAIKPAKEEKKQVVAEVTDPKKVDISGPLAILASRPAAIPREEKKEIVKATYSAGAFFDFDKSVIKPEGKQLLDNLIEKLKGVNIEMVIVIGHTDNIGEAQSNLKLSQRRAETVRNVIISMGVEANRLTAIGKGDREPKADNSNEEGRLMNRRVEVKLVQTVIQENKTTRKP